MMTIQRSLTPAMALHLAAPHTWAASLCPALFGVAYSSLIGRPLGAVAAVLLLGACILMQASVNTFNDYFDFVKGADSADDYVEASDSVLVYEHIDPRQALLLAAGFLVGAALLAAPVIWHAGPLPLIIGVVGGLTVLAYSGGSHPISYFPIGEFVSGFVMGGLIPLGIVACTDGRLDAAVLLPALPFMIGISLIMLSNNGSDIEKDRDVNRRTLPVVLGRTGTVKLYRALVVVWLALLVIMPVYYLGTWGLITWVLLATICRKAFSFLLHSVLAPPNRVQQMKTVTKANFLGNGAYIVAMAAYLLGGAFYG